ncbi:hypothetical protein D3C76_1804750 [compost metagenome]
MIALGSHQFANRHHLHFIVISVTFGLYRGLFTPFIGNGQINPAIPATNTYLFNFVALIPEIKRQ